MTTTRNNSMQDKVREIVRSGNPSNWDTAWQQNITPWDAGVFQPPLSELIESGDVHLPRQGRALVPGCGSGYDVVYLASALSLKVIGMDVSETAIQKAKTAFQVSPPGEVSFQVGDFFHLKDEDQFDLIYDYTFFVAIPPTRRAEWGQQMASLVKPGGFLITLVWPIEPPTDLGPPFFVRVEHYENVLNEAFEKVLDKVPTMSLAHHVDKERIVVWKPSMMSSRPQSAPATPSKPLSLNFTMGPRPLHLLDGNIPLPPLSPPLTAISRKPNPRRQSSISYYHSGQVAESSRSPLSPPPDTNRRSSVGPGSFSLVSPHRDTRNKSLETPEHQPLTLVEKHSELLHFIAQKESKCLELRSQLAAHEAELLQLKRKWERIVNRGLLDTPSSPSTSSAALLGHGAVLDGIVEGVQGVGRFIAAGLPASPSPVHSPPSSFRPLRPTHLNSQSTSSTSTSTIKSASTRLSQSSASSLGEDGHSDYLPLVELHGREEKDKSMEGHEQHTQILMVHDTGATPTMSPNPTFEHHCQQRIQHSEAANLVTPPNTSKLYRRRSRSRDVRQSPVEEPIGSPLPLRRSLSRSRSPSPVGLEAEKLEAKRLKRATINGTSFPPVSSIPGLAALTVGQAATPVPSWIGSVGKKWDELQRGSTFSKNQKRASILLSDVSQSIMSALSPPSSASASRSPRSSFEQSPTPVADVKISSSLLDEVDGSESSSLLMPVLASSVAPSKPARQKHSSTPLRTLEVDDDGWNW